jgi:hypothetical protein
MLLKVNEHKFLQVSPSAPPRGGAPPSERAA